jgi:hypothetical protein
MPTTLKIKVNGAWEPIGAYATPGTPGPKGPDGPPILAGYPLRPPQPFSLASGWTWENKGPLTVEEANDAVLVTCPPGGLEWRYATTPLLPVPAVYTLGLMGRPWWWSDYGYAGLALLDGFSNNKTVVGFRTQAVGNTSGSCAYMTGNYVTQNLITGWGSSSLIATAPPLLFIKLTYNSQSSYQFSYSWDGYDWYDMGWQSGGGFLTTPNRVGLFLLCNSGATLRVAFLHWSVVLL